MKMDAPAPRWFLVVKSGQDELAEILRQRLEASGVEVVLERRTRERRRGSLGPAMDRRVTERRRQRAVALVTPANVTEQPATPLPAKAPARAAAGNRVVTHRCPTCLESIELELPRFPHPPARVETEVRHATVNGREGHYVEIAAFTVSGRLILSQRVPARRIA